MAMVERGGRTAVGSWRLKPAVVTNKCYRFWILASVRKDEAMEVDGTVVAVASAGGEGGASAADLWWLPAWWRLGFE